MASLMLTWGHRADTSDSNAQLGEFGCSTSLFSLNVGTRAIFPMAGHNVTVAQQL